MHIHTYIYIYIWIICSHFSNVLLDELAGDDSTDAESERVWEAVACLVRLESTLFLFRSVYLMLQMDSRTKHDAEARKCRLERVFVG